MTMLDRYETIRRAYRVKGLINEGTLLEEEIKSKVYRVRVERFPSGEHFMVLVWSNVQNKCIWVKADKVTILSTTLEPIHRV